jgi:hypothetical protein
MCSRCEVHAWRGAGSAPMSRSELFQRSAAGAVMVGLPGGVLGASIARERTDTLREMGYIAAASGRDLIDWTLLEEAIAENRPLWDGLARKSALSL